MRSNKVPPPPPPCPCSIQARRKLSQPFSHVPTNACPTSWSAAASRSPIRASIGFVLRLPDVKVPPLGRYVGIVAPRQVPGRFGLLTAQIVFFWASRIPVRRAIAAF